MKKIIFILAAMFACIAPQTSQAIDVEGIYVGGQAGFNFMHYKKGHFDPSFKAGWLAGVHGGYRWCNGIRAEGELSYRRNNAKHCGNLHIWSLMANGLYEIPLCWCVTPYVGAGIGYDSAKQSSHHGKKLNGFAWQLITGLLYPIDDCLEMYVDYKFHHGNKKDFYNNTIDIGLNWFF